MGVRAKALTQLKDDKGSVVGFLLKDTTGVEMRVQSASIIKAMNSGAIEIDNLRVVTVNNKQVLVDQDLLTKIVNKARKAYEQEDREIISNKEYDALYDVLQEMEGNSGVALKDSATQNVGYEVVSALPKKKHAKKMLSLDKTKSTSTLAAFLGNQEGILSWKEDGLTVVCTYKDGTLVEAVTRGNGEIGEVVTPNARQFVNLPNRINFTGELIIRGEALISYDDFNVINSRIADIDAKYKNPRNLCSGSVRQLDSRVTAQRHVQYRVFEVVKAEGKDFNTYAEQLTWIESLGFQAVDRLVVTANTLPQAIGRFQQLIVKNSLPTDGLVLRYNNLSYGNSLGETAKFPRHSLAFKWKDEEVETVLTDIEWSPSRTGLINPVAIFKPVDIEGTTVARASVHNLSIMAELELGIGDHIMVYKSNMIIPQVSQNLTRSSNLEIPGECPACGHPTSVHTDPVSGVQTLYCDNPLCPAKSNKLLAHFVSRDAMNIEGISESTLIKLQEAGIVENFADLYHLEDSVDEIVYMPGFGYKSYENMVNAVNRSRKVKAANLIYALGIPNIGLNTAKLIAKNCGFDIKKMVTISYDELLSIDGIGGVIADSFVSYFQDRENQENFMELLQELEIQPETASTDTSMGEIKIAVHGTLFRIKRRDLKDLIESMGGKLVTSVNKSTTFLVTNQPEDNTKKCKDARSNNVAIISEDAFIEKFGLKV